MKKSDVDLANAVVWIPDSKTPNGIAEVPLTSLAVDAFTDQFAIAGPGLFLFPSNKKCIRASSRIKNRLDQDASPRQGPLLPDL